MGSELVSLCDRLEFTAQVFILFNIFTFNIISHVRSIHFPSGILCPLILSAWIIFKPLTILKHLHKGMCCRTNLLLITIFRFIHILIAFYLLISWPLCYFNIYRLGPEREKKIMFTILALRLHWGGDNNAYFVKYYKNDILYAKKKRTKCVYLLFLFGLSCVLSCKDDTCTNIRVSAQFYLKHTGETM